MASHERVRFSGHIGGVGTASGIRLVIGTWAVSPFGAFTDVMVQLADGERILLAPNEPVAEFVGSTYHFDRTEVTPITAALTADRLTVDSPLLSLTLGIGGPGPFDALLRLVPQPLSRTPWWLRAIDPVASRLVAGVHTAGTAGNGRREYYGVRRTRRITDVTGRWGDVDLGPLRPLHPPVRFGFASAPETPQLVSVTTTIDLPTR